MYDMHSKKNWLLNLSSATIPEDSQCLLQLGENFSLPTINLEKTIIEVVKNIENNTNKFPETQLIIRNRIIPIINNLASSSSHNDFLSTKISQLVKNTKLFSKNNPNILFTRADKGNITVALDRDMYTDKITKMLQDKDTYTKINENPIWKISDEHCLLKKWKDWIYFIEYV